MFDHFVLSVLGVPLLTLLGTWLLAERIRPDLAAPVITWSAVVVAVSSFVNIIAFSLKAAAETSTVADLGDWSDQVVRADTRHVAWVSAVAVVWTAVATAFVVHGYLRYRRALRTAWSTVDGLSSAGVVADDTEPTSGAGAGAGAGAGRIRAGRDLGAASGSDLGVEVVLVADPRVEAFALPGRPGRHGRPGRVVVTTGLRSAVDADMLEAIIAHERAHLTSHHHRLVWLARFAGLLQPILWPMTRKVEYLIERAADEAAAQVVGDRADVARAIAHAALAAVDPLTSSSHDGPDAQAPTARGVYLAISSPPQVVPRRMAAMTRPPRSRRWLLATPLLLAAGTVVWTGECVYDLNELLITASRDGRRL
ncbi:M56 family metallopeptidase [Frankia sp. AgPm24]|uniref:M56 family metallopeptidase n=1 Tax=Frankia sp. AgPm24 TaxID=631128 RepID=UPI00200C6550|nr:M56 family metallopeptidase [Frankia sp. AgPm24]MCK9923696.1 M56 family metallopeptidase [Frankia sp. AgPm24]